MKSTRQIGNRRCLSKNLWLNCPVCGTKFQLKRESQKFCSYKCAVKGRKTRFNQMKLKCDNCRKEYSRSPSLLKNYSKNNEYKKHFCSTKCKAESQRKSQKGNINPNWKGGISFKIAARKGKGNRLYRKGRYYENKARKELEKDGYYVVRSAASKGIWDLIAIKKENIKLIQVKANNLPGPDERKKMAEFRCPKIVTKEIWRYYGMGEKQIITYKKGWNIQKRGWKE